MYRIYFLFFMSGIAGLVYQVVWSRLLNEIFGVTVYAVTTVLATFLGGLALGGFLLGRLADRMRNPLAFYGWLEIGTGLTALAGLWVIRALDPVHIAAANRFPPDSAALIGVRVLLAAIIILPPTFLMGGTLPSMTRVFVDRIRRLGRQLSFLYALNTLGAVVGTLAAGFLLIRLVGVHATLWIAVALNLAVGFASLWLAATRGPVRRAVEVVAPPRRDVARAPGSTGIGLLVVIAVCGFASLGLEVAWTRMLVLIVGTNTYAFVTMLASFLVGITVGSFIARAIVDRVPDVRRTLGWVQVGIAVSALATLPVLGSLSASLGPRWLGGSEQNWFAMLIARFGVSSLVMLVPTTLIGMTFPLAGKIWARDVRTLGGNLGQVYGANTLGNILGAAITGFALLPAIGLQKSVALLAALSLANAAWGLYPGVAGRRVLAAIPRTAVIVCGIVLGVAVLLIWTPQPLVGNGTQQSRETLYYKEGLVATTLVYRDASDHRKQSMAVDRIKIGDSYGDVDMKQQGLAHFPFLLMPERSPRTILSIGLGTGILVGETAKHPSVQTLDCVEIAPTVIEGARLFDEFNDKVLDNNTVQIICDDGVNFLRRTATRYDAIISDAKSRTSHAGNALFFSEDYYQLCHEHLERGGVMIQWVPLNVPHEELPIILRTFLRVFRYSYVWLDPPGSCFLVGTKEKLVLDIPHIQRVLDEQRTADLRRYGWSNAYGFVSLLTADYESLAGWLSDGNAINSLEHPILEFYSPRAFAVPENERVARNLESLLEVRQDPLRNVTLIDGDMTAVAANARAAARLIAGVMRLERQEPGSVREGLALLDEALALAPDHGRLQYTAANAYFGRANELALQGQADAAVAYLRRAVAARPDFAEARFNLANALATRQRYGEAASHYRQVIEVMPDFAGAHFNLANVLASQGEYSDAAVHYRRTLRLRPDLKSARERLNRVLQLERQSQPPGRQ